MGKKIETDMKVGKPAMTSEETAALKVGEW